MSQKILFVLHRIGVGGSMTSLLNLLELLKADGVECDLFLMDHSGAFLERAKNAANLLPENKRLASVICNKEKLKKSKDIVGLAYRISYVLKSKLIKGNYNYESIYKKEAKKLSGYNTVVAFQEGLPTDFVQYIKSERKVAWAHQEYKYVSKKNPDVYKTYLKFNHIVCVSGVAQRSFMEKVGDSGTPVDLVYNTLNEEHIKNSADAFPVSVDESVVNFVSLGRMADTKRFDRIIPVAKRLKEEDKRFHWIIVGGGELFESVYGAAKREGLLDVLEFVGAQSNPYPYIKAADCVVLTSQYETHPMVAIEGLILGKPIITTNYPSAREVVRDGENGIICSNGEDGIYRALSKLINDKQLFENVNLNAKIYKYDNSKILNQVKEILQVKNE